MPRLELAVFLTDLEGRRLWARQKRADSMRREPLPGFTWPQFEAEPERFEKMFRGAARIVFEQMEYSLRPDLHPEKKSKRPTGSKGAM